MLIFTTKIKKELEHAITQSFPQVTYIIIKYKLIKNIRSQFLISRFEKLQLLDRPVSHSSIREKPAHSKLPLQVPVSPHCPNYHKTSALARLDTMCYNM